MLMQVERAAAVADGSSQTSSSSPPGSTGGGASEEDVRGPHASLAVRLQVMPLCFALAYRPSVCYLSFSYVCSSVWVSSLSIVQGIANVLHHMLNYVCRLHI